MGARLPGSSAPYLTADLFTQLPASDVDGTAGRVDAGAAEWPTIISEGASQEGSSDGPHRQDSLKSNQSSASTHSTERSVYDDLAELLMDMIPDPEGAELGDSFLSAAEVPPVTKQSLSELDIQNIISNIKLRHDVNFDRDLSFRPNLDGPKGQEKMRQSSKYWQALVAELELYVRLFQGAPSLCKNVKWTVIVQHAKRRIPKMFETIHEVLKSLVPDRDHPRVDEHLDVPMLMQEIERGVFDLVKLADWIAVLLKEHCAPMRDVFVDEMVQLISTGITKHDSDLIVNGLRKLLGILEAMKLDVANHQIRNLKTLLIEDTISFERHYHLDKLVTDEKEGRRPRVDVDAAHRWWLAAANEFGRQSTTDPNNFPRFQFELFQRAVSRTLFSGRGGSDLPDTFYLDYDRIRVLASEIDELVHLEICFNMFEQLARGFGFERLMSRTTKHKLRSSLSAIIGEGARHGPQSWMFNSEPLSLEIYRQALSIAGRPAMFSYDHLQKANQHLRFLFQTTHTTHAAEIEAIIVSQVLSLTKTHNNSSPIELFNNLVTPAPPTATQSFLPIPPSSHPNTLPPKHAHLQDKINDLSNRLTHIILLHWRIWGPIAYIQENDMPAKPSTQVVSEQTPSNVASTAPQPQQQTQAVRPPPQGAEQHAPISDAARTGEPPDPSGTGVQRGSLQ